MWSCGTVAWCRSLWTWYPRLAEGSPSERRRWELLGPGIGIHWPDLDEDISVDGLLEGLPSGETSFHLTNGGLLAGDRLRRCSRPAERETFGRRRRNDLARLAAERRCVRREGQMPTGTCTASRQSSSSGRATSSVIHCRSSRPCTSTLWRAAESGREGWSRSTSCPTSPGSLRRNTRRGWFDQRRSNRLPPVRRCLMVFEAGRGSRPAPFRLGPLDPIVLMN